MPPPRRRRRSAARIRTRIIIGIVITPVETVVATAEPDTEPMRPEPMTATCPAPPWYRPATPRATVTMKSPAPDFSRNAPNRMNMKTNVDEMFATMPNMPSPLK